MAEISDQATTERLADGLRELLPPTVEAERLFNELVAELVSVRQTNEERDAALRELAGYVRSHLAGNDADPELAWALEKADAALASGDGQEPADTKDKR